MLHLEELLARLNRFSFLAIWEEEDGTGWKDERVAGQEYSRPPLHKVSSSTVLVINNTVL